MAFLSWCTYKYTCTQPMVHGPFSDSSCPPLPALIMQTMAQYGSNQHHPQHSTAVRWRPSQVVRGRMYAQVVQILASTFAVSQGTQLGCQGCPHLEDCAVQSVQTGMEVTKDVRTICTALRVVCGIIRSGARVGSPITRSNAQVSACIDSGKVYAVAIVLNYLLPPLNSFCIRCMLV